MDSLRKKIVVSVFVASLIVFALVVGGVGLMYSLNTQMRLDITTEAIDRNGGEFPARSQYEELGYQDRIFMFEFTDEAPFRLRYFTVYFEGDEATSVSTDHIASVGADEAKQIASDIRSQATDPNAVGYYGGYRYRVADGGERVVCLECMEELTAVWNVTSVTALVSSVFVFLLTLTFCFMSARIVEPFEENSRRQKQFVTDAGHELKTPLAIISANAEVLEYKNGGDKWVSNIIEQTKRLSKLIDELLTLSKLDEVGGDMPMEEIELGKLVEERGADFAGVFSRNGSDFSVSVKSGTEILGNEAQLARLVSILLENASKYTEKDGKVEVRVERGRKGVILSVFNECSVREDLDYDHLFDRFYRPDSSRDSSTGGHGIGLSIAKRIVELHRGTITAQAQPKGMLFVASFPPNAKTGLGAILPKIG